MLQIADWVPIGYVSASTVFDTGHQRQLLWEAGVREIYEETETKANSRPELKRLVKALAPGSMLTVPRMDQLASSLKELLELIDTLDKRGSVLRSLEELFDMSTPGGRQTIDVLEAVNEFERSATRQRAIAGQVAAVRRGVSLGRPKVVTAERAALAVLRCSRGETIRQVALDFGVSESALRSAVHEAIHGQRLPRRPVRPVLERLLAAETQVEMPEQTGVRAEAQVEPKADVVAEAVATVKPKAP